MTKTTIINSAKEDLIATIKAITGDPFLQVDFTPSQENNFFTFGKHLVSKSEQSSTRIILPEIKSHLVSSENDLINQTLIKRHRAAADLASSYHLFHHQSQYQDFLQQKDIGAEEEKFLAEFEKIRVIACSKDYYLGLVQNILAKVEDSITLPSINQTQGLALTLLSTIFPQEILTKTRIFTDNFEKNLSAKIRKKIKNLSANISDQSLFAHEVIELLDSLKEEQENQEKKSQKNNNSGKDQKEQENQNDLNSLEQENSITKEDNNFTKNLTEEESKAEETETKPQEIINDDSSGESRIHLDKVTPEEDKIEFKNPYKIFTNKFDEIIFPQKLIAKSELEFLRDQLDLKLSKLSGISKKMTMALKKKLLSKRNSFIDYDASRGILNRKKLTRLVIDPMLEDIWINTHDHEYQNTALTILLDNSGSMRGNPIVMSALACEIIASILEKFSIKTEIIGFTTADWKGGKARKLWESTGKPHNPGRLNELRHIIYKHFNQKFKKAKINLGLMLKEGILKENIDGEALLFARGRLSQQSEKRKILLVISDGTPVDDSTLSANDSDILTDHLRHVIHKIENNRASNTKVEIVGIGIGHTTEDFYKNSITIKNLEELGDVMIEKITNLL